eukprot:m.148764 g.148764  ORF g.148764 m.148764 type:complete len:94 (-) comp9723_c0_seq5:544-825(-)
MDEPSCQISPNVLAPNRAFNQHIARSTATCLNLHGRTASAHTVKAFKSLCLNSITFDDALSTVVDHPVPLYMAVFALCVRIMWATWTEASCMS